MLAKTARWALALAAISTISACTHQTAWRVTGESVTVLGHAFAETGKQMDAALDAKRIDEATYRRWAAFCGYFTPAYNLAYDRWKHGDDTASEHAAVVLATLAAELAEWEHR